jgi:hypothetical protein
MQERNLNIIYIRFLRTSLNSKKQREPFVYQPRAPDMGQSFREMSLSICKATRRHRGGYLKW